jgi:hypothetical protein
MEIKKEKAGRSAEYLQMVASFPLIYPNPILSCSSNPIGNKKLQFVALWRLALWLISSVQPIR